MLNGQCRGGRLRRRMRRNGNRASSLPVTERAIRAQAPNGRQGGQRERLLGGVTV